MSDIEEARGLLGIAAGASADELRRAYMRAIRRTGPERDPEGFQRIRAAYELLREGSLHDDLPRSARVVPCIEVVPDAPAPEAERDEPRAAKKSFPPLEHALELVEQRRIDDAKQLADDLLAESEQRADPQLLEPRTMLLLVLALHRDARPELANELFDRWYRLVHAAGVAVTVGAQAMLVQTAELCRFPADFPPSVRELLARGIQNEDPQTVEEELRTLLRDRPLSRDRALHHLVTLAPALASHYAQILRGIDAQLRMKRRPDVGLAIVAPLLVLLVLGALRRCDFSDRKMTAPPPPVQVRP